MLILEQLFGCKRAAGAEALDARFNLPGSRPQYAPDRSFDTDHIKLELSLDVRRKSVRGVCTTRLRALADGAGSMVFDAVRFKIRGVRMDGRALRYAYDGQKLTVRLPRPVRSGSRVEVAVAYQVDRPPLGMHFIGPDRKYPRKPIQVWTQGEDEFARYWFPCHDAPQDRTTTEMIVDVPRGMTAVSNGRLLARTSRGPTTRFHWRQDIPHATYLVTLAAGYFSEIRDRWRNVPVLYYCPPGREEDAKRAFGKTPRMMEFFSRSLGVPYPYPKYAQVAAVDFIYGGMENTSATTQTALTLHDERAHLDFSSDPLVAHELAHQWFGDLLTCKDWSHAWLNESFATYFEALFKEFDLGPDEFAYQLRQNADAYFSEDKEHYRRPIVTKIYKQPSDLFDRHLYEKGSLVLHMLRTLLGDKAFWKSMNAYVTRHRGQVVETSDLVSAIQAATGRNMWKFFDQWVLRGGHPEYKVKYWWQPGTREACVRVVQTQAGSEETGLFSMPIVFSFWTAQREKRFTENVEKKSHLFRFKLPSEPDLVLFDPDHAVLKKTDFVKTEAMWIAQLTRDPHALGRLDAARALGRGAGPAGLAALTQALLQEKFWAVQGEIARSLGSLRVPEAVAALVQGLDRVTHPKARRILIEALGEARPEDIRTRLRASYRREPSYFVEIQSLRALAQTGDMSVLNLLTEQLGRESWNDILRSGALDALAALKAPEAVTVLTRHTAWGYHQGTRMTAIRGLAQLGAGRSDVQRTLIGLTRDPYLLVQLAAVRALSQIGDERAVPALKKLTEGHLDGRLKRSAEEAIQKIKKGIEDGARKT
jgi:aminopeptidase N